MDENVLAALESLDVAKLDRSDWITVGMALKDGGYPCSVWDDWSRMDVRYHPGECQRKWDGFHGSSTPVKIGTVIDLAKKHGWVPRSSSDAVFGWDDEIGYDGDSFQGFSEKKADPADELITYLETLFEPDEYVAYVTNDIWQTDDGKYVPSKGCYNRTRDQLIEALKKWRDDLTAAIGTPNPEAGAWIRFNPVDGKGVKNENVTRFSYALVESDEMSIDEQETAYRKLELPIAALVYSGGKSLHAIVRVDAKDADEYRKRVLYLYDYLEQHGVKVDKQNKNPSRLSRMPGIMRNGNLQHLIATNIGRKSWNDWMDVTDGNEDPEDPLPDILPWTEILKNLPPVSPPLIDGILRVGHKMMVAGPSKAGKSFLLLELANAIARGGEWLGHKCKKGNVLYVNFEIQNPSFYARIIDICNARHEEVDFTGLYPWGLRGHSTTLDKLIPIMNRKIGETHFDAIILDPIYKVITGDENNASEMGQFCNYFDKICNKTGAALIYCHHHAKGAPGGKSVQDRASGSGVFARDPDAILDMSELYLGNYEGQKPKCQNPDDEPVAFRIESSLREFRNIRPINVWYVHPLHIVDTKGELKDLPVIGTTSEFYKMAPKYKPQEVRQNDLEQAYDALKFFEPDEKVTVEGLSEYMGISKKTVYRRIKECGGQFEVSAGEVKERNNEQ